MSHNSYSDNKKNIEEDLLRDSMAYLAILNQRYFKAYDILCLNEEAGLEALTNLYFFIEPSIRKTIITPKQAEELAKTQLEYNKKLSKYRNIMSDNIIKSGLKKSLKLFTARNLAASMVKVFEEVGATHKTDSRRLLNKKPTAIKPKERAEI